MINSAENETQRTIGGVIAAVGLAEAVKSLKAHNREAS